MEQVDVGVGRFEAFTIVDRRCESAVQESMAAALGWLSGRLTAMVADGRVVSDCSAAVFDIDAESVVAQWHGTGDELAAVLGRLAG